ncbi:MAG TPA: hypothetical protein VIE43_24675 [Thermoanaerobaculia bacterium]|nr:hypothetical protein [Thermoanaerobaculia bacterium]
MDKNRTCFIFLIALVFLISCGSVAQAQATRTWVSGTGDDANPCSRTAPCKTFAGAISKTASAGEINVLDPGGFGAVTITKSITISSEGFEAGVLVSGTNGININAPATSVVTLRGLDIEGVGTGLSGIKVVGAGAVHIEKCVIEGFKSGSALGIDIEPTLAGIEQVFIKDTIVRNNGTGNVGGGILFAPGASTSITASLDNVRTENNVFGVKTQDRSTVSISNSVAAGNGFAGFSAVLSGGGPAAVVISRSESVNNGTGVLANGSTAVVRITNVTVSGNGAGAGLATMNAGQIVSAGDNFNSDGGAPTSTPGHQ